MDTLKNDIRNLLVADAKARDNDNRLYALVIKQYSKRNGYTLDRVDYFFNLNFSKFGIPTFESVSRMRRKVQSESPELKGSEQAIKARKLEQAKYRAYFRAKGK